MSILPWLSWFISLGCMSIGAFALIAPRPASRMFGIADNTAWVQAAGARDIFIGLAVKLVFMHSHFHLLGEVCAATAVVPACDAALTYVHGAKKHALAHLGGMVAVFAYGLLLIFTN